MVQNSPGTIRSGFLHYFNLLHSLIQNPFLLKVAYYSIQKRKITFLKLKFKASRSFTLGYLLLHLLKEIREAQKYQI